MNVPAASTPPSLRLERPGRALGWCLGLVLAAGGLACGGSAGFETSEAEPLACSGDDASCAPRPAAPIPAGELACSVVSCPPGTDICCSSVSASATGNDRQAYDRRVQLVESAQSRFGEVRAEFTFDAPNQQGWITFELGTELDLSRLAFIGRREGVADRFLAVNTNRLDDDEEGGCAFSFDLDPRGPFAFGNDIFFNDDEFCYGPGRPGRVSELAFAIFSTRPGPAALVISNLALIPD